MSWNPTVANLTSMALGSSAPEIILALYETIMNLDQCPGELGASTIVGSAAFNLLVISGLSIYAVDADADGKVEGVKKIEDMGVYAVTATSSVLAYVWMFYVLLDQNVSVAEAWLTFIFAFLLIILAYGADRYKKNNSEDDGEDLIDSQGHVAVFEYTAMEVYRELVKEK